MSTELEVDAEGFTAAERAYFASGGANTEGLLSNEPDDDVAAPEPAPSPSPAPAPAAAEPAPAPAPAAKEPEAPEDLDTIARVNRSKTGRVIPEENFRVVSSKYKERGAKIKELEQQLAERETKLKAWDGERAETEKLRERVARMDERLKLFSEALQPQEQQPAAPKPKPNKEEDIFAYSDWLENRVEQLAGALEEVKGQVGQVGQTVQERDDDAALSDAYRSDAVAFARDNQDFGQAYVHLNRVRDAMLESIGYADPKERAQIRQNEEKALVARALQAGKRPAEVIYGVAKSLGYTKAAPAVDPAPAPAAAPASAAPAPAPAAPSVTEEIERIQRGQVASRSLSSGGGAPAPAMTVEQLANMPEAEFEQYARKNPLVVKALMGG